MKWNQWLRTRLKRFRGLQVRMTLSSIGVTLAAVMLLEVLHTPTPWFQGHQQLPAWNRLLAPELVIVPLLGGVFGIISTWGLVRRLRQMALATTCFARGQYDQRLPVTIGDEMGQLEAYLNQMAEDLAAHLEREKILAEQNARLEERARLSQDLHDSVKQQMFALAVQVELARTLLDQDSAAARKHLLCVDELSYQVQQELTTLIQALRPADLQTKGFVVAVRDYVERWSRQSGIAVALSLPPICLLSSSVEEALWRILQEALSNVARHSQASQMCLHLETAAEALILVFSDNGQGFDPLASEHVGFGLRSIRERIEQIGGTVLIHSTKGSGTQILIRCPLLPIAEHTPVTHEVST